MISFGGSSRQSLAALRQALDASLAGVSANDASAISTDLFQALAILDSSAGLRRALTDPSRDESAKATLVADLYQAKVGEVALALLKQAAGLRWSSPSQLSDAVEQLAVEAEAAAAGLNNQLDEVLSQLFAFSKLLLDNPELRRALNTADDSVDRKVELLANLLAGAYNPSALRLLQQAVRGLRGRNIERTLDAYSHAVTARRARVNVHVRSAVALSEAQQAKLASAISKQVGGEIHLNVEIDPQVIGGISIRFADEVIDGTIVNRLAQAREAVVG